MLWRIYAGLADRFGPPCVAQMDFDDGVDAWDYALRTAQMVYDKNPAVPFDVYMVAFNDEDTAYDAYRAECERHIDYYAELVE